jgi:protein tyrosine phosphatase
MSLEQLLATLGGKYSDLPQAVSINGFTKFKFYKSALLNDDGNRYRDILPYPNRVILESGAYINASQLPGPNDESKYIATQAPLPHTMTVFWEMVWEKGISLIVMLTKFIELKNKCSKVKAHCYWPDNGPVEFERIQITLIENEEVNEHIHVRNFLIKNRDTDEIRNITHIHYTGWPDHGIPSSTDDFQELIRLSDEHRNDGPILAHCSAGVGRAGTFLTVRAFLDYNHANIEMNVFDIVSSFRKCRPHMVQTESQYNFILDVLRDYYSLPKLIEEEPCQDLNCEDDSIIIQVPLPDEEKEDDTECPEVESPLRRAGYFYCGSDSVSEEIIVFPDEDLSFINHMYSKGIHSCSFESVESDDLTPFT